ncbi:MAG: hypothetical protein IPP33_15355 [Flavobacteriales bacterium]|nr:hypothetical protein [Flavobacteriales bacterium]
MATRQRCSWRTLGTDWRKILVIVEDAGDYKTAAWEAGKFITVNAWGRLLHS